MYKGELKELKDIPLGTPVEIVERDKFAYRPEADDSQALVGILTATQPTYKREYNTGSYGYVPSGVVASLRVHEAALDKFVSIRSTEHIPLESKMLKVLTGRKAEWLRQKQQVMFVETKFRDMYKSPVFHVGSDPEMFVVDERGEMIPAWKFLPGKKTPYRPADTPGAIDSLGSKTWQYYYNQQAYWDGFQTEFSGSHDACAGFYVDMLRAGLKMLREKATAFNPNARLTIKNVFEIPPEVLESEPPEHIQLGCDPSLNIYDASGELAGDARLLRWRFTGGHVHLGVGAHEIASKVRRAEMIKGMDSVAGVLSVGMFAGWEDPTRRRFYGLAGEHRLPSHGIEYRVLSNCWLTHPAVAHLMLDLVRVGAWIGAQGLRGTIQTSDEEVQQIINTCDVTRAREMVERNRKVYEGLIYWVYQNAYLRDASTRDPDACVQAVMQFVNEGLEAVVREPDNLERNWSLGIMEGEVRGETWVRHSENENCQWNKAAKTIVAGGRI